MQAAQWWRKLRQRTGRASRGVWLCTRWLPCHRRPQLPQSLCLPQHSQHPRCHCRLRCWAQSLSCSHSLCCRRQPVPSRQWGGLWTRQPASQQLDSQQPPRDAEGAPLSFHRVSGRDKRGAVVGEGADPVAACLPAPGGVGWALFGLPLDECLVFVVRGTGFLKWNQEDGE
jgi:hypothetical protein